MRVVLISGEYPPMRGGVGDYTEFLAAGLARQGAQIDVLTSERVRDLAQARPSWAVDVPNVRVHPIIRRWSPSCWDDILELVKGFQANIVHVQYQTGAFEMRLGINLLPWRLRFMGSRPGVVVTFHDVKVPYVLPKIGPLRHVATFALEFGADAVIATNHEDLHLFGARDGRTGWRWGRRPLEAIPIGSNIPTLAVDAPERAARRQQLNVHPAETLLSYFGFLGPEKGIDVLVEAIRLLLRRGRAVKLLMVGGSTGDSNSAVDHPYEHAIRQDLDSPDLRGHVLWTGFTGPGDVSLNLQAADICVLPFKGGASLRHGTLIAAITHGLAIVTTRPKVGGIVRSANASLEGDDLPGLENEASALLVEPENSEAIAAAIERLIDNPGLHDRLVAGTIALRNCFLWDRIAQRTLRLYQSL